MPSLSKYGVRAWLILVAIIGLLSPGCAAVGQNDKATENHEPWFLRSMAQLTKSKIQIMQSSLPNCEKTYEAVINHIVDNLLEIRKITKAFQKLDVEGTKQQKDDATHFIMAHLGPILEKSLELQNRFTQLCPQEQKNVSTAIKSILEEK